MAAQLALGLAPLMPPVSEDDGAPPAAIGAAFVGGDNPPLCLLPFGAPIEEGVVSFAASPVTAVACCRRGRSSLETGSFWTPGCWLEDEAVDRVAAGAGAEDAAIMTEVK